MSYRIVTLHGGPRHGEKASVEDGRKKFVIIKPAEELNALLADPTKGGDVKIRTGSYSAVANRPADFEWDGWEPK